MKPTYLAMLSVVSLLSLKATILFQAPVSLAQVTTTAVTSGTFVAAKSPTQGAVQIVTENGQRYLELDQSFATADGPDLFVLLHRAETPESYEDADFVNLGELQRLNGIQRYAIPDTVNLADYRSAVIWCREFNVTMGASSGWGSRDGVLRGVLQTGDQNAH